MSGDYARYALVALLMLIALAPAPVLANDAIVALTNDLGCWFFAAPPPDYRVFIRRSESAESGRVHFGDSVFGVALGYGPRGESLVARHGGVYRLTASGPSKILDLPPSFSPSAILSAQGGTTFILGNNASGNVVAVWNGVGSVVVEPSGGNSSITSVDLAADGCTAIWAAGNVYRTNLCVPPRNWELWIPATHASAAFFAPGNEVIVQSLRQQSPSGSYVSVLRVHDATSLDLKREFPSSRVHTLIGLGSDGRSFWMMPSDCGGGDLAVRKYALLTGNLLAEVPLYSGDVDDRPHIGMVERGWRAALPAPAPVSVPSLSSPLLIALSGILTAIGCWSLVKS